MNVTNIEIFSLLIIFILFFDYYNRFKYRFNKSSFLFLGAFGFISLLSIINILLTKMNFSVTIDYLIIVLGFYLIFLLPIFFYEYIKENFLNTSWYLKIKKYLSIIYLLFISICICLAFFKASNILEVPNNIQSFKYYNILLLLSLIPIMVVLMEYFVSLFIKKERRDTKAFWIIVIALIGLLLEVFINEYYLLTPTYVAVTLLLHQYKNELMNTKDVLTGLYNREMIHRIQNNRRNDDKKLIAYMIDVDKFKYINDTYGHHKGDKILKDIASLIYETVRESDYVIRYGGDEFIIIANMSDDKNAPIIIDKIKNNLKVYNQFKKIKVSLSFGYEVLKPDKDGRYDLYKTLKKADKRMYEDKRK